MFKNNYRAWIHPLNMYLPILVLDFDKNKIYCGDGEHKEWFNFSEVIIEEYSRRTDIYGNEIWEGNGGIHSEYGAYYIKRGNYTDHETGCGNSGFYVEFINEIFRKDYPTHLGHWIINERFDFKMNIHENPELLEEL